MEPRLYLQFFIRSIIQQTRMRYLLKRFASLALPNPLIFLHKQLMQLSMGLVVLTIKWLYLHFHMNNVNVPDTGSSHHHLWNSILQSPFSQANPTLSSRRSDAGLVQTADELVQRVDALRWRLRYLPVDGAPLLLDITLQVNKTKCMFTTCKCFTAVFIRNAARLAVIVYVI